MMASISTDNATNVQLICSGTVARTVAETMAVTFSASVDCTWAPNTSAGSNEWWVTLKSIPL